MVSARVMSLPSSLATHTTCALTRLTPVTMATPLLPVRRRGRSLDLRLRPFGLLPVGADLGNLDLGCLHRRYGGRLHRQDGLSLDRGDGLSLHRGYLLRRAGCGRDAPDGGRGLRYPDVAEIRERGR